MIAVLRWLRLVAEWVGDHFPLLEVLAVGLVARGHLLLEAHLLLEVIADHHRLLLQVIAARHHRLLLQVTADQAPLLLEVIALGAAARIPLLKVITLLSAPAARCATSQQMKSSQSIGLLS